MAEHPAARYVVAVDMGGTLTKVAYAYLDSSTTPPLRVPTRLVAGSVSVPWLGEVLADAIADRPGEDCAGLAVAVPGIIDVARGIVRTAPNVGWFELPLRDKLSDLMGRPVVIGQDVRAGGLAEYRLGAAVGAADAIFLALGTGVAAAIFANGEVVHAGGYAGEVGHIAVAAAGDTVCACGQVGCLETVASATGLARRYAALSGQDQGDARTVADRARRGDRHAQAAFALAVEALTEALVICSTLLGPEVVVIGGGLSGAFDLLGPPVAAGMDARMTLQRRARLVPARLGADAGVIGAGLMGWDSLTGRGRESPAGPR